MERRVRRVGSAALLLMLAVLPPACGSDPSTGTGPTAGEAAAPCVDHVVDSTGSEATPGTELAVPADEAGRVQLIADTFCSKWTVTTTEGRYSALRPPLTPDDARCVADGLVEALGMQRIERFELGRHPWGLLGFGIGKGAAVTADDAKAMVDVFARCSPQFERLMIFTFTEGTDQISDESGACVADELDDDDARVIMQAELDADYGTRTFAEVIDPLVRAYDECLTPEERARLDFN